MGKRCGFQNRRRAEGTKGLGKDHWRHREGSQQGLPIIESLGASPQITREITLVIVGSLSVAIEPSDKSEDRRLTIFDVLDVCSFMLSSASTRN